MKTTIDIPEPLYKKAKIRAIERGLTLKQIVLTSLERELASPPRVGEPDASYWANRNMTHEFQRLMESGSLKPLPGSRSIDEVVADTREDATL